MAIILGQVSVSCSRQQLLAFAQQAKRKYRMVTFMAQAVIITKL
jgi:hypothetical protein